MAGNQLTASGGSGTQTTTQSPQAVGGGNFGGGQQSSSVQPGTPTAALTTSQGGLTLNPSALSIVNLNNTQTSTGAQTSIISVPVRHHGSWTLYGLSGSLFIVAIVLFWITSRSAKSTTKYE